MSSRVVDVWALVESIVLTSQERVVLSAMLEFASFVRPSTRFGGVHIDQRYSAQNPATGVSNCPSTARRASRSSVGSRWRYRWTYQKPILPALLY